MENAAGYDACGPEVNAGTKVSQFRAADGLIARGTEREYFREGSKGTVDRGLDSVS